MKALLENMVSKFVMPLACLTALLAIRATSLHAQSIETSLKESFYAYQQHALPEKIYMHTDKNFYLCGEICWFRLYNTDGFFNKPLGLSKLAYVEVLDKNNKPVIQTKISLKDGKGNGSVQWPVSLPSGNYKIRAYTNWMKNFDESYFFEKTITLVNTRKAFEVAKNAAKKPGYDIQFFPEGGNMVNGIQSRIAFRVVDHNGRGVFCKGKIIDEKGDSITSYSTLKFGLGSFGFTPQTGHAYKAVTELSDSVRIETALPAAFSNGYVMHFDGFENNALKVTVRTQINGKAPVVYLFVHTRGSIKTVTTGLARDGYAEFYIDTSKLGAGISHFTVFNEERKPVCERLFFKKPSQQLVLAGNANMQEYDIRKKVAVNISSADAQNKPLSADMSLAVYRIDSLAGIDEMDISNYLWLTADLGGTVESPAYYFGEQNAEVLAATENLLMTQGWRKFKWDDVLEKKLPAFEFAPEYKGHLVKGKIISNITGKPASGSECFLSVASTRSLFRGDVSDDSGNVKFEMNNFYGNNEIIAQITGREDTLRRIEIANPYSTKYSGTALPSFLLPEKNANTLLSQNIAVQVQHGYVNDKLQQMELPPGADTLPFYVKADAAYKLDDYVRFTTIEEVLREYVPDVNVRRHEGKFVLPVFDHIRKEFFTVDPLLMLDGVPVFDVNKFMAYDPLKIRRLEVVARMYFYGDMYFGGIVNFITYKGDLEGYELDPHTTVLDYETLQMEREFFSPVYGTKEEAANRLPDFRTLLYWSPEVVTNKDGKTEISFYTSDMPGRFAGVLQGITPDGKTGSTTFYFNVKQEDALANKK
ncbi:MAG: hypothetical protein QM726_20475 [Chitinophagaceae bacterium]